MKSDLACALFWWALTYAFLWIALGANWPALVRALYAMNALMVFDTAKPHFEAILKTKGRKVDR